ncbi:MAG: formylglycine-generating enzyme family protein [Anaerolineae bacterium]
MQVPETVMVPAGAFLFGVPPEQRIYAEEADRQRIDLPAFRVGRTPVTVEQYRAFVLAGGYTEPAYWSAAGWRWRIAKGVTQPAEWENPVWAGQHDLPVGGVSWYEAYGYTQWLSARIGEAYRRPYEAEWEKAARGTDGRLFPWGDTYQPGYANVNEVHDGLGQRDMQRTSPVGQFPQGVSPYGTLDMVGNVQEWCGSAWRDPYVYPEAVEDVDYPAYALRGGAWYLRPKSSRIPNRVAFGPRFRNTGIGFRVIYTSFTG